VTPAVAVLVPVHDQAAFLPRALGSLLAQDCAEDGQYEFFYAAAPLKVAKGSGSPVNPLAIK